MGEDEQRTARGGIRTSSTHGLAELDARLDGRVLRPGSEDYTALATPWNLAVVNDHLAAVSLTDRGPLAVLDRVPW
jgi:hypothetical protein